MAKAPKTTNSKTTKKPSDNSQPELAKRNPLMLPILIGAVIIGVVLGMTFNTGGNQNISNADFDAKVEAYIQQNAGVVIDALNTYVQEQAEAEQRQSINLVKANDGNTILGNPNGDVTIYEFSDYNCGYCKRAFNDLMSAVEEDGNIRVVVKEFPILSETSMIAAQLSMAAAEIGRFEDFHTSLMQWQGRLDDAAFTQIANNLEIDMAELAAIIAKGDIDEAIAETQSIARSMQITGTPGFIIGDQIIPGYIPKDQILSLVRQARES